MKSNIGIYKITNTENKKVYVGSSFNLRKRKYQHFFSLKNSKHPNNHLQHSFDKYGEDIFKWEVIEYLDTCASKESLLEKEQYYLDLYKENFKLYNILDKAGSPLGYEHTDKVKEKLREAGRNISDETRRKRSETLKGHSMSEETKKKISQTLKESGFKPPSSKGRKLSDETKKKLSYFNMGKKHALGYSMSKENKSRLKERMKDNKYALGHVHSEETKLKMKNSSKLKLKVRNIDTGLEFNSILEASKYYNVNNSHIGQVCRGKRKTCGGYRWEYINIS